MEASKYSGHKDFEWAVRLNRYSLTLIGLWPNSERTTCEKIMCNLRVLCACLAIIFIVVIPAIHSLIRIHGDIMLMIDNFQFTLPAISAVLRIVIFWWKIEGVTSLVDMIEDDWLKPKAARERMTMIGRAQTARLIIMCGYSIMVASFFIAIIMPAYGYSLRYLTNITDPGRPLPLQTYYVYDVTKSPQYELTFVSQAISIFVCVLPYTGIDNFLGLTVFHICGQLDTLREHITHLDKLENFADTFKNCVMVHTRLLRATAIIEDIFNVILLILLLYFGILFASYGFLLISLLEDGNNITIQRLAFLVIIIMNMFGHMCVYCAVGDILTTQCDQLHYAAYSNKWYTLSPRNARNVILLMARTNDPFYLTAGKIFPMTIPTFCNLIKTSVGYISVLLATRH